MKRRGQYMETNIIEKNVKKIVKLGTKKKSLVIRKMNRTVGVSTALKEILFKSIESGNHEKIVFISPNSRHRNTIVNELREQYNKNEFCKVLDYTGNRAVVDVSGKQVVIIFLMWNFDDGFHIRGWFDLAIADEAFDGTDKKAIMDMVFSNKGAKKVIVMTKDDNELIDFDCNYIVV